jgi:hypothetical protein
MSFGFTTCADCGERVPWAQTGQHECDEEQWLSFQVTRARPQIDRFEHELARYLETARGKFDLWYAERTLLRGA